MLIIRMVVQVVFLMLLLNTVLWFLSLLLGAFIPDRDATQVKNDIRITNYLMLATVILGVLLANGVFNG